VITVDARGHRCPVPTLRLRRALEAAAPGEEVELLADDPLAKVDVPHFAAASGCELRASEAHASGWRFVVRRRPAG
jgi:tRNA 2-thiouridine synthesizing protein A